MSNTTRKINPSFNINSCISEKLIDKKKTPYLFSDNGAVYDQTSIHKYNRKSLIRADRRYYKNNIRTHLMNSNHIIMSSEYKKHGQHLNWFFYP